MQTILLLTAVFSAPANLHNAQIDESPLLPAAAVREIGDGWIGFSFPMNESRHGSCCWRIRRDQAQLGCALDGGFSGFIVGQAKETPRSDSAHLYAQVRDGQVEEIHVFGAACPVDAEGAKVMWLERVPDAAGFEWAAEKVTHDREDVRDGALLAVAFHADQRASQTLYDIALGDSREDSRENAVFWLGESRGEDGAGRLERLLHELPTGDVRRKINFALSQNDSPRAADLLLEVAGNDGDEEQRADALFWLAESGHPRALEAIVEALDSERSEEVVEKALFALAELETEAAAEHLTNAARGHRDSEIRGQALFWLAQSYPRQALDAIMEILQQTGDPELQERAVFALSQLPEETATASLLEVMRGPYPKAVRKQALFWLAESDDPAAMEALEAALGSR